jgi:hypothetical protein
MNWPTKDVIFGCYFFTIQKPGKITENSPDFEWFLGLND